MRLIFAVMAVLGSACVVCGADIQYKTAYVDKYSTECYLDGNGNMQCRKVKTTELTQVPVSSTVNTVPANHHAHRANDGSIVIHHNDNYGISSAHVGMSSIRVAEAGQVISSVAVMQAFSGNSVGYRSLTPIRNFIANSQIRPLARVAGVVKTFFSRFRR